MIPAIGVDTSLVPLGLGPDGTMEVPTDYATAGWYVGGPFPGQPGPAVIAGHVDSTSGPAVFFGLGRLRPGDIIEVRTEGGGQRFIVEALEQHPKAAFPTARVFGPTTQPALRLITCGGAFDRARQSYRDNLVVLASASTGPPGGHDSNQTGQPRERSPGERR